MGLCIQKETNQLDYIIEDYTKSEITPDNDIVQLTENGRLIEYRGYDYNDSTSINMKLTFPVGNSITFLDLSYLHLRDIGNVLPYNLTKFICRNNKIKELPLLPFTLEYLDCSDNIITNILVINENLKYLNCMHNKINKIRTVYSGENNKKIIVNKLPDSMIDFNCVGNNITELPILNNGLQIISCENYNLKKLQKLPNTIKMIDFKIEHNKIEWCLSYKINNLREINNLID